MRCPLALAVPQAVQFHAMAGVGTVKLSTVASAAATMPTAATDAPRGRTIAGATPDSSWFCSGNRVNVSRMSSDEGRNKRLSCRLVLLGALRLAGAKPARC